MWQPFCRGIQSIQIAAVIFAAQDLCRSRTHATRPCVIAMATMAQSSKQVFDAALSLRSSSLSEQRRLLQAKSQRESVQTIEKMRSDLMSIFGPGAGSGTDRSEPFKSDSPALTLQQLADTTVSSPLSTPEHKSRKSTLSTHAAEPSGSFHEEGAGLHPVAFEDCHTDGAPATQEHEAVHPLRHDQSESKSAIANAFRRPARQDAVSAAAKVIRSSRPALNTVSEAKTADAQYTVVASSRDNFDVISIPLSHLRQGPSNSQAPRTAHYQGPTTSSLSHQAERKPWLTHTHDDDHGNETPRDDTPSQEKASLHPSSWQYLGGDRGGDPIASDQFTSADSRRLRDLQTRQRRRAGLEDDGLRPRKPFVISTSFDASVVDFQANSFRDDIGTQPNNAATVAPSQNERFAEPTEGDEDEFDPILAAEAEAAIAQVVARANAAADTTARSPTSDRGAQVDFGPLGSMNSPLSPRSQQEKILLLHRHIQAAMSELKKSKTALKEAQEDTERSNSHAQALQVFPLCA